MNKYIIESFEEYVNGLKINEDTSQIGSIDNFFNDKYIMDTITSTSLNMYIKLNDLDVNSIDKIRNSDGFNEYLKNMNIFVTYTLNMYIKLNDLDVNSKDEIRNSNGFIEYLKNKLKEIESKIKNPITQHARNMDMLCDMKFL